MTKPKPLTCPECGCAELQLIETTTRYYALESATTALVRAIPDWPPDIDDEGENQRLRCSACTHEWPIPKGTAFDFEGGE